MSSDSTAQRTLAAAGTVMLVAIGSLASFAAQNRQQYLDVAALATYAAACAAVALIGGIVAARLLGVSTARALVVAAVVLAAFLSFDVVQAAVGPKGATVQLLAWMAATTLIAAVVVAIRDPRLAIWGVAIAAVFALPPIVVLAVSRPSPRAQSGTTTGAEYSFRVKPNVYFFLLDGYLRPDLLPGIAGGDDGGLVEALQQRGFTSVDKATANYPVTWLSLGSTLSLDYIQLPESPPYPSVARFHDLMRGRNRAVEIFKTNGYRYVHVASGHTGGACTGEEDQCIEAPTNTFVDELELALLKKTPAYVVIERFRPQWLQEAAATTWTQIHQVHDRILTIRSDAPSFVFAQFLAPHPPFLWRADCTPQPSGLALDLEHWSPAAIPLYVEAIACTNARILRLIDAILAKDPSAVFVVQSDHGSSFFVDWKAPPAQWSSRAINERLSPLSTMRLPANCPAPYPAMSLVNTMRLLFSCLAASPPDYLPDRWFITPDSDHPDFGKVVEVSQPGTGSGDGR